MNRIKREKEKLISDFAEKKIGYRQIWKGFIKVDDRKIEYRRYSNITDIDNNGTLYITDDINILTKVDDVLRVALEEHLLE